MPSIYVNAPGTVSGGLGTIGSPYTHLHEALAAMTSTYNTLEMNGGTYTLGMSWNTMTGYGGWKTGTSGNPFTIKASGHTDSTIRGVTGGTSSVIWQPSDTQPCINYTVPSNIAYHNWRGIVFDARNLVASSGGACVTHNGGANNISFRNCQFRNIGTSSGSLVLGMEYVWSSTALLNNSVEYCFFNVGAPTATHFIYCRSNGNRFRFNTFYNGPKAAVQYFADNIHSIDDNIVEGNHAYDFPNSPTNSAVFSASANINRNKWFNNIVWNCPTRNIFYLQGGSGISGISDSNAIVHNTVVGCGTGVKIRDEALASDFRNTIVKNNLCYDNSVNMDLGSFAIGTDASNNATDGTDPVFTNAGSQDYSLAVGSPYKTAGVVLSSPYDVDIAGIVRPQNTTPSIGAYEYNAGLTPGPPVNLYANPGGYTIYKNISTVITQLSVSHPDDLVVECWLSMEGANATFTVDTSSGATSH